MLQETGRLQLLLMELIGLLKMMRQYLDILMLLDGMVDIFYLVAALLLKLRNQTTLQHIHQQLLHPVII